MIKYLEITKDTLEIWAGPFTADTLPVFADDSPHVAKEVINMPDTFIVPGQIWNDATSSIEDTQDSINWKARAYLSSTDWYVIRQMETGEAVPADVTTKRAESRSQVI